ncbi:MATE family efflux transporter [Peribacillus saganii]|uniref:Probable multidrug resistance protein NorM n=1 Tax=Peribacillus saganii TaxID=2303992 RepID=A0A372LL40_9BACI|nr:MATE family efflux transporter [Peribacillus saganii]RFU66428.1 MATE family efflux transporter [Peribacillus saganii]
MQQTFTINEKLKQFILIVVPILVTQLGMFSMNFLDTMMSGRFSAADLAGVAIGSSIWTPVFTGLSGILLAITPIVSQQVGAKDTKSVPFSVTQGVYLAVFMSLIVIIIGAFVINPILDGMNLDRKVRTIAFDYLVGLSFGMIALFVFNVLRSFIDALGQTRISMMITLISLPINALLNYMLIYGKWEFPQLGGAGTGYATAITYWLVTIIAAAVIMRMEGFAKYKIFRNFYSVSLKEWKAILKIGVPIGFAIFFETSIFSAVTLLMSTFDTVTIAAYQSALNFSSFLYMVPLSISMALTIVVGFEVGAKRLNDARVYSRIGIAMSIVLAALSAVGLFFFREQIASVYTEDPDVLAMTAHFLAYALFFLLSDAIQAPIQGALRGYKDVNFTFLMSFISFWVIGLPTGYLFVHFTGLGASGYWIGLIVGLAVGALGMSSRLYYIQRVRYRSNAS